MHNRWELVAVEPIRPRAEITPSLIGGKIARFIGGIGHEVDGHVISLLEQYRPSWCFCSPCPVRPQNISRHQLAIAHLSAGPHRTDGQLRVGVWKYFEDAQGKGYKNTKTGDIARAKK